MERAIPSQTRAGGTTGVRSEASAATVSRARTSAASHSGWGPSWSRCRSSARASSGSRAPRAYASTCSRNSWCVTEVGFFQSMSCCASDEANLVSEYERGRRSGCGIRGPAGFSGLEAPPAASSAGSAVEGLRDVPEPHPQRPQRDGEVVHDVRRLLDGALRISIRARRDQLGALLAELLQTEIPIRQQLPRVARLRATRPASRTHHGVEPGKRARLLAGLAEAGDVSPVTGRSGGGDVGQQRVRVAIGSESHDLLRVAAGLALPPETAAPRGVVHLARCLGPGDRLAIGLRDHQDGPRARVPGDDDDATIPLLEVERHLLAPSASRTSAASAALLATAFPPKAVGRPLQSVNTPPASSMIGWNAAASQGAISASVIASARPVATSRYP